MFNDLVFTYGHLESVSTLFHFSLHLALRRGKSVFKIYVMIPFAVHFRASIIHTVVTEKESNVCLPVSYVRQNRLLLLHEGESYTIYYTCVKNLLYAK